MTKRYTRTKIRCIETGIVFENLTQVAKVMNCTKGAISNHLSGRFPHIQGLTFERIPDDTKSILNPEIFCTSGIKSELNLKSTLIKWVNFIKRYGSKMLVIFTRNSIY